MAGAHRGGAGVAAARPGPGPRPAGRGGPTTGAVDLAPASAYEALTRQMVEGLAADLDEIKGRLNGLLWMVAGAIVLDVVIRVAGVG